MPIQKKKKIDYLNEIKKFKQGICPGANISMKRETLQGIARELRKTNKSKKLPKSQQVSIKMKTPDVDRNIAIVHKKTKIGMPSRAPPSIKTTLKSTVKPRLQRAKQSMPSRKPPVVASTVYEQKALERRLITINEKAIGPVLGYFSQNQWTYDDNKDKFLNKWLPKIISTEGSASLNKEQKRNAVNFIKGLYKVKNPKDLPKTSKDKYEKLLTVLEKKYN